MTSLTEAVIDDFGKRKGGLGGGVRKVRRTGDEVGGQRSVRPSLACYLFKLRQSLCVTVTTFSLMDARSSRKAPPALFLATLCILWCEQGLERTAEYDNTYRAKLETRLCTSAPPSRHICLD
jgi:hypothetical protein